MPVASCTCSTDSAAAQRLLHEHDAAVGGARGDVEDARASSVVGRSPSQWKLTSRVFSSERSAFCSASVKLRPIAIASPTDFIVVVRRGVGGRELLEREPRHLDDDVVERRLEARPGSRG